MGILDAPSYSRVQSDKRLQPVRSRMRIPAGEGPKPYKNGLSNGTDMGANSKKRIIASQRVTDLTVKFGNFYALSGVETLGPNNITVRCAVFYNGTYYPLRFRGSRDVVIEPGALVETDSCGIDIPAGAVYYIMTYITVASAGMKWGLNTLFSRGGAFGEEYVASTSPTDLTTTGGFTASGSLIGYGPVQVLCRNTNSKPYVAVIGDSITDGSGDTTTADGSAGSERGWIVRALIPNFPLQVLSQPGGQASQFTFNQMGHRMSLIGDAEVAIVGYGTNDLTANKTFVQLQAALQYIYDYCAARGMRVFAATIPPFVTSTDGYLTLANQTIAYTSPQETIRKQINDWMRTLPAPLTGYFEAADAVESARDSGKWRVDLGGSATFDGKHPSSLGYAAMQATLDTSKLL